MIRLGDGTTLANQKTQHAIDTLWKFSQEFFHENETDKAMKEQEIGVDLSTIQQLWLQKIKEIVYMAHLTLPKNNYQVFGGKEGNHSEFMGYILAEMQFLPNKYPDAKW
jgi:ring-1,2-phenylacetyl-CoA epoxidase subunit PaaC